MVALESGFCADFASVPGRRLSAAGGDFDPAMLEGAQLRLIFKSREAARAEHELDRFTQARDNYAMMSEEHPSQPRLNLWNRFAADLTTYGSVEGMPRLEGRNAHVLISPIKTLVKSDKPEKSEKAEKPGASAPPADA